MPMRVLVSGGGTAGHISPLLALADELKLIDPTIEIIYVGSGSQLEAKIAASYGWEYVKLPSGKLRRYRQAWWKSLIDLKTAWLNSVDMVKTGVAVVRAWKLLGTVQPDVVFVKGGF